MKKENSRSTKQQRKENLKDNVTGIIILIIVVFAIYQLFGTPFKTINNKAQVKQQVEVEVQK